MQTRRELSRLGRPLCACSGSGVFVGYASLFGERDQSGDVVMPGAFAASLKKRRAADVRMLFQHDAAEPVGSWIDIYETPKGLHVTGRLDRNVQRGRELFSLLESSHAGSDHRFKLNKNAAADTASLLFQTGWSGRAEMGLTGSDDFRINVSGDGAAWKSALVIDRASGAVSLPNTPQPAGTIHAQSLSTQGPGFAVDSYLAGSAIAIPAGRLKPGTRYGLTFDVNKTAAGVAPPVITLRFGASGSLADAALGAMAFLPQTAVADDGLFTLDVTFRSVGVTAVVQAVAGLAHTLASAGLATGAVPVRRLTSAAFDATAGNAMIGVSVNAGAAAAWTVSLVQARLENMA